MILEETIELTLFVERLGADGVLVVNPFYWNLSDEQIYVYYAELAKAVNIDIYLYNIPQLTGQEIPVCVIEKLAKDFDNIRGIKETVSSISRIRTVINELNSVREDFYVYSAFDEHLLDAQILGAAGSINGTSVFLPELSVRLYEAIHNSDFSQVKKLHIEISNKMELYSWHPSFYISMKEAVYARWFPEESVNLRTPFINNEQDLRSLAKAMIEKAYVRGFMMKSTIDFLEKLGYPGKDYQDLPTSTKRFPDGAQYRIELPSVEGPKALKETLKAIDEYGLTIHRISQGNWHYASNG